MTKRSSSIWWLGGVIAIIAVVSFAIVELRTHGTTTIAGSVADFKAKGEEQNTPAPTFRLPSLQDGQPIALESFRGHVLVLNFWASWCAPCRLEAPGLRWVAQHYYDRGVRFLGADEQDSRASGKAFTAEFDIPYSSVFDPAGSLADDYEFIGLPTTFILDPTGTIRYRFLGYLDRETLRSAVDKVLSASAG